jgi:hypothetical protein
MCKPNKSLRMTVRAFIKAEEKKKVAAAEAAAAAAIEQEEASAPQAEQLTEQPEAESEIQAEPVVDNAQEDNVADADATEGALAPEATDPLAQVEEVRLCHADGRQDILTCMYRSLSTQLLECLRNWIRSNSRLELRKKLLLSQLKKPTLKSMILSKRTELKANKTKTDRTLLSKTFKTWTGTPLTDLTL